MLARPGRCLLPFSYSSTPTDWVLGRYVVRKKPNGFAEDDRGFRNFVSQGNALHLVISNGFTGRQEYRNQLETCFHSTGAFHREVDFKFKLSELEQWCFPGLVACPIELFQLKPNLLNQLRQAKSFPSSKFGMVPPL